MRKFLQVILLGAIINALFLENTNAAGISVDAGLTPAEDRWIVRTQMRYMQREDDPTPMDREMDTYAFPLVVAYGLRSDLTLRGLLVVNSPIVPFAVLPIDLKPCCL